MADARRAHEYDIAIATIVYLGNSFAGEFKPATANPFRKEYERELTEEEARQANKDRLEVLKSGLAWMNENSR